MFSFRSRLSRAGEWVDDFISDLIHAQKRFACARNGHPSFKIGRCSRCGLNRS